MGILDRMVTALRGGKTAWDRYGDDIGQITYNDMYAWRLALYNGDAFTSFARSPYMRDSRIYANTRLIFSHVNSTVKFYALNVYSGDLSTDGEPLPDGSKGAIPIDPQVSTEEQREALLKAISELWSAWNWKKNMTKRPKYAAALADVMTELIDDTTTGFVYPQEIRPDHVKDIELDYVGNVKSYTIEYRVIEKHDDGETENYVYKKEVDKDFFRWYKDGDPFDYDGDGLSVVPNPYGFVPAIWDVFEEGWSERGSAAVDSTWQALQELNSLLSHGKDYQHKAFNAPVIVQGQVTRSGQSTVNTAPSVEDIPLVRRVLRGDKGAMEAERQVQAETSSWLQGTKDTGIVQLEFDIGKTLEMVEFIKKGILDENPEASFYNELRTMSQVTAPGAERLLGDAVARCKYARAGMDANSVKLFQMAISMCGFRANEPNRAPGWQELSRRQQVFQPFTLNSYKAGEMDFSISDRPVILPTESERYALIQQQESLETTWGLEQAGRTRDEIASIMADRDVVISSMA